MHFKKTKLKQEADKIKKNLGRKLDWNDYDNIVERCEVCAEKTYCNTKKQHMEKFSCLQQKKTQQQGIDHSKWVVNLSSQALTDTEENVLRQGLNYAPAPQRIPYMDIAASVEVTARTLDTEEASELRGSVCSILKRAKPPPPNLSNDERRALKTLKQDQDVVFLPADKGNITVVMDSVQYEEKIKNLLDDPVYLKVKRDPTAATERKVLKEIRRLEKEDLIPKKLGTTLKPSASTTPKLYGLTIIHKPEVPLRPIVSCIGSPTYQLAKHLTTLITSLNGQTPSFIMNSQHFVESVKHMHLQPSEVMVSFDIKSLFTKVPVDEALQVIRQKLEKDENLGDRTALTPKQVSELLELCLKTTFFSFRGQFYMQTEGAAMGSPVSPVVANIYMEMFEELALRTAPHAPRIWKRYVDDTFCVMERRHVDMFLEHINNIRPSIQFTMDLQSEGTLPLLDTLLTRTEQGNIDISVHRKPTQTNRYIQYTSHHPPHVKSGVASCLFHRAQTIATGSNIKKEEEHLSMVLSNNSYPNHVIQAAAKPKKKKPQEEQPQHTIYLPYVAGVGEDLRRVCRKHQIRTVFITTNTLGQQLTKVKDIDPTIEKSVVVYKIPCRDCDLTYNFYCLYYSGPSLSARY